MDRTFARSALAAAITALSGAAAAVPITVTDAYHYLDNRGPSNVGTTAGLRTAFGALTVLPGGSGGTTGTAVNADYLGGTPLALFFNAQVLTASEFNRSLPAGAAPTSPWTLTFSNGGDTRQVTTPSLAGAVTMGFARNVAISGTTTPTISWLGAAGQDYDAVRLNFYNLDQRVNGLATLFRSVNLQSSAATGFTVPTSWNLTPDTHYSVEIGLIQTRDGTSSLAQPNLLSRSRSYFDFSLLDTPVPGPVYLPTVIPGTGSTPYVFTFNITGVSNTQTTFIDPEIAIGYDYRIGAGNPNFAAVELPSVGDGQYALHLWNGSSWSFAAALQAGELYEFGAGGVSQFRILGIEASAGLDASDGSAFVTGLRFTANGDFTGSMTPLTLAAVPEPGALVLMSAGLALLVARRRRLG